MLQLAVVGPSRWAAEGVAQALRGDMAAEVSTFGEPKALAAASRRAEITVALVARSEQVDAVRASLAPGAPVLWLVEPGAPPVIPDRLGPCGVLQADADAARLRAALVALAQGLSVHEPALAPAPDAAELIDPLTARELEVFELLAKGLPNRDIARVLGISPHTAKFHVAQILEKTGCATRTEAVGQGLRLGLVGL